GVRATPTVIAGMRWFVVELVSLWVEMSLVHPTLGGAPARPFRTHHNTLDVDLYLRVAPELYLKRLVVGGFDRVYELGHNFRNEGIDRTHNPEFAMLEFYQAYATYEDLIELTEELFCQLATEIRGGARFDYQGTPIDFARPWPRASLIEVVRALGAPVDDTEGLRAW